MSREIITVKDCINCVFRNDGEYEYKATCNIYQPPPFDPYHKLTTEEHEMEYELPNEIGKYPKLCPLGGGKVFVVCKFWNGKDDED